MPFQSSPGISVTETDLTTVVPAVSTTQAAFAGNFSKGPTGQRILVDSEDRLVSIFGTPNETNYRDWFTAANFLAYGNALYVVRVAGTGALNAVATGSGVLVENREDLDTNHSTAFTEFLAKSPGVYGNSIKISVCPNLGTYEQDTLYEYSIDQNTKELVVASSLTNFDRVVSDGDLVTIGGSDYKIVSHANTGAVEVTATLDKNYTGETLQRAAGRTLTKKWAYYSYFDRAPQTTSFGERRNITGDAVHIAVIDENGAITGTRGQILETFPDLSLATDAKTEDGSTNYFANVINARSQYLWFGGTALTGTSSGTSSTATSTFGGTSNAPLEFSLTNGAEGTAPTPAQRIRGYDLFRSAEDVDISIILAGDSSETLSTHLITNIADTRKDCIVCISPLHSNVVGNTASYDGWQRDAIIEYRNLLPSSSYAVMDSGWKYQYDKYNDVYRYVPMNADTAGQMVVTDHLKDAWHSPAGHNRGNIKNVVKLAYNPSKADRDQLYRAGVNSITTFTGQGTVLYGDKTMLSHPSAFDRINVRRLFIVLRKAISRASQATLFELNNEFTRTQFRNLVEPFLRDVQGREGITSFRVVADGTNNNGEVIDRNEFVGDIYVVPARPINEIHLNFSATRTGVEFNEIVGRAN